MRPTKLRLLRVSKGLRLKDLGGIVSLQPSALSLVERRRGVATKPKRRLLAEALGVEEDALFDDSGFALEAPIEGYFSTP